MTKKFLHCLHILAVLREQRRVRVTNLDPKAGSRFSAGD